MMDSEMKNVKINKWFRLCPSCHRKVYCVSQSARNCSLHRVCQKCYLKTMIGKGNPHYGKKHSVENLIKMRNCKLGKRHTVESRIKISKNHVGMTGKHHSTFSKEKMRQSNSGINAPCYGRTGNKHPMYGKHHSDQARLKISKAFKGRFVGELNPSKRSDVRKKIRIAAILRISKQYFEGGQIVPSYNSNGCKFIDEYGKQNNYKFQHALNGGEHHIKELGYFVDGYDKEKNVVFEYDEKKHFTVNGKLKQKDVRRMNEIIEHLNCKFYRYNEQKSILTSYNLSNSQNSI